MPMLLFLLIFTYVLGDEFFVAPHGNDASSGSKSAPFASIQHGLRQLNSGDTLSIISGTYTPRAKPSIWQGGTAEEPILIRGAGDTPPVIDASGYSGEWAHGFEIGAPYIRLENLHIRNAKAVGISVWKTHNVTISRCIVNGSWGTGIGIQSDTLGGTRAVVVEECEVYNNVLMNAQKIMHGGWGSGIGAGHCRNVTFRNNRVYENYGEGILAYLSDTISISGNISRDNFSVSIYIDNATEAIIENNLAYSTGDTSFYRNNHPATGFQIANETEWYNFTNPSKIITVQNNLFVSLRSALYYGNYQGGGGLKGFRFRYNTSWNSTSVSVHIDADDHEDVIIEGNMFVQNPGFSHVHYPDSPERIIARNNLWFGGNGPYLDGMGDVFEDPLLPGGGTFEPAGYIPPQNSPAAGSGGGGEDVTVDFFGYPRSAPLDIGAFAVPGTTKMGNYFSFHANNIGLHIQHTSRNLHITLPTDMSGSQLFITLTNLQGRLIFNGTVENGAVGIPRTGARAIALLTIYNNKGSIYSRRVGL